MQYTNQQSPPIMIFFFLYHTLLYFKIAVFPCKLFTAMGKVDWNWQTDSITLFVSVCKGNSLRSFTPTFEVVPVPVQPHSADSWLQNQSFPTFDVRFIILSLSSLLFLFIYFALSVLSTNLPKLAPLNTTWVLTTDGKLFEVLYLDKYGVMRRNKSRLSCELLFWNMSTTAVMFIRIDVVAFIKLICRAWKTKVAVDKRRGLWGQTK